MNPLSRIAYSLLIIASIAQSCLASAEPATASGTYEHGTLIPLTVHNRTAYLIQPKGTSTRRKPLDP
ncbi:MAG: hypothetical protein U0992_11265 [Planctomycetaceae bacterium]